MECGWAGDKDVDKGNLGVRKIVTCNRQPMEVCSLPPHDIEPLLLGLVVCLHACTVVQVAGQIATSFMTVLSPT